MLHKNLKHLAAELGDLFFFFFCTTGLLSSTISFGQWCLFPLTTQEFEISLFCFWWRAHVIFQALAGNILYKMFLLSRFTERSVPRMKRKRWARSCRRRQPYSTSTLMHVQNGFKGKVKQDLERKKIIIMLSQNSSGILLLRNMWKKVWSKRWKCRSKGDVWLRFSTLECWNSITDILKCM